MILVINCGSSTVKYQLFTTDVQRVVAKGIVSRIGEAGSYFDYQKGSFELRETAAVANHHQAFELCIACLMRPDYGAIRHIEEIQAVGHRAVHGGDLFLCSTVINDEVIEKMEECVPLAPLHNPPNLIGIREARQLLPDVPHVAVFDTAFNQSMPARAFMYAIPYHFYKEHKIRKYGFHGTSVRYVSQQAAEFLNTPIQQLKMVVLHLGNGVTMTAVDGGLVVDSSIGFATFSGVMMGTRSGDIDPGIAFYLHRQFGYRIDEIENILYKQSGLLGISGLSNDMRTITKAAESGNEQCQLAMELFAYMAKKYLGSYAAAMGGVNCIVFTAGIGENSVEVRQMICEGLDFLGIRVDPSRNMTAVGGKQVVDIREEGCPTAILVVPTDEEKMIALDTRFLAKLD